MGTLIKLTLSKAVDQPQQAWGVTDEPAKSPSSEASSQEPIRVSDKIHRALTGCWNRGAGVGLAMGGVKKESLGAQQQDREEKLQGKESISLLILSN
jgi:hypothetical protein